MKLLLLAVTVSSVNAALFPLEVTGGCVVTGNILYVNGIKSRQLNSREMNELSQYENAQMQYRKDMKQYLQGPSNNYNSYNSPPKPPQKPSFCSDEVTTQYYYPGCMIQGNKVYVGRQYARDLTPQETQELNTYNQQMAAYEDYMAAQIREKMQNFFQKIGDQFDDPASQQYNSNSNNNNNNHNSNNQNNQYGNSNQYGAPQPMMYPQRDATPTTMPPPPPMQEPEPPRNICVTIY